MFPYLESGHGWIPLFAVFLAPYVARQGFSVKVLDMELYGSEEEAGLLRQYVPQARMVGISAMTAHVSTPSALTRQVEAHPPRSSRGLGRDPCLAVPRSDRGPPARGLRHRGRRRGPPGCLAPRRGASADRLQGKAGRLRTRAASWPPRSCPTPITAFWTWNGDSPFRAPSAISNVLTSRGCPYKCTFCVNTIIRSKWRGYPAERSIKILRSTCRDYRVRHVFMMDENFFGNVPRAREIVAGISDLGITWEANIHIRNLIRLDADFLRLIKRSGAVRLRMGAESGSDRILGLLRKNITAADIAAARDRCFEFGIKPMMSFMIDLPDELPEETAATMKLAEEWARAGAGVIGPQPFRPYPGNEESAKLVKRGLCLPDSLEAWEKCDLFNTICERPRTGMAAQPRIPWRRSARSWQPCRRTGWPAKPGRKWNSACTPGGPGPGRQGGLRGRQERAANDAAARWVSALPRGCGTPAASR